MQADVDVVSASPNEITPLHIACTRGHLDIVQYLVDTGGANIEAETNRGRRTPLHLASQHGHKAIVEYLIDEGHQRQANIYAKDVHYDTPLDKALKDARYGVVDVLLRRMSSIDERTLQLLAWNKCRHWGIKRIALEKYAIGCGLGVAYQRNPIHIIFSHYSFHLSFVDRSFVEECVEHFPRSALLSSLDDQGRLLIHVVLTSACNKVNCPSSLELLLEREPRFAVARDPVTGLYPHETIVKRGILAATNDTTTRDDSSLGKWRLRWLDVVYTSFRCDPQQVLQTRFGVG
uniref:Uncharacterized protein n=1 Tax=Grammatophora oceanica TaxID=210454 RepID=A0A7S1VUF9_9STRA|mmetsp:Transcript_8131/g.11878  ORF Transcript_8131/g.11878 Transcript_8131/m.11878 type:complete len:290 (+) Transcript_8131:178-1047(+)